MPHVFVETNWLFAYAAPAHHQAPDAAELYKRASRGEFLLHLPNVCFGEARQAILAKCQPRNEVNAIRSFLTWGKPGHVSKEEADTTRVVLEKFRSKLSRDLERLDETLRSIKAAECIRVYGLDEAMLERATDLALSGLAFKPFDHAILASVLVSAEKLWEAGERDISFCEADADLQPWDKYGNPKPPLQAAFDKAHVQVYGDFTLIQSRGRMNLGED